MAERPNGRLTLAAEVSLNYINLVRFLDRAIFFSDQHFNFFLIILIKKALIINLSLILLIADKSQSPLQESISTNMMKHQASQTALQALPKVSDAEAEILAQNF